VKYLFFLLFAGLSTLASCQNNTRKSSSPEEILKEAAKDPGANAGVSKFTIDAPAGWQKIDTSINGIKFTFLMAPAMERSFRANINVISQSMNNMSMESYFDTNVATMGQYMEKFSVGPKGEKKINGLPAKWVQYSHTQNGYDLDGLFCMIPKNGIAYIITFTVPKGSLNKYQGPFDEALNSFRVN
jgi:hypothetical protein